MVRTIDGVGDRRPRWGAHSGDIETRQSAVEVTAVDGIPVVDQVLRSSAPGRRLQELVPDPGGGRTGGDVEVDQFPPFVADNKEDEKGPEAHCLDNEQVGRPDAAQLICKEASPALVVARPQPPPSVAPDGTVAHHDAELQHLAADALGPPERILVRDPADERLQLSAEAGSTESGSRLPGPIEPPTLPVPAQDRLRLHQMKVLAPAIRPETAKPDPKNAIAGPKAGMRVGPQRDLKLMAEGKVLERKIPSRSNGSAERTKHTEK